MDFERGDPMSWRERYIFRLDMAHVKCLAILIAVSGIATSVLAVTPADAIQAADKIAGMNVTQLMALICIVSTIFSAWVFWAMSKTAQANADAHLKTAVALEGISTELKTRPCIRPRIEAH